MAIFASTTLGSSDPSRALSIKALEARAQALAAQQAKQETPTSLPSPWQGAGYLANTFADALGTKQADQAAAQRRQDLAGYIAKAGDNPTMADVGRITAADTDVGKTYLSEIQQRRAQAAQIQAQKELATQKAQQDEAAAAAQEQRVLARPPNDDVVNIRRAESQGLITKEDADARVKKLTAPAAAEQKAAGEEQNKNIELQSLVGSLQTAQQLGKEGIYGGPGATAKTFIGSHIAAGGGPLSGMLGMDAKTSERTQRFNSLMSGPILQTLNSLKGASSDRELNFAIDTLNNADATVQNKLDALDTIMRKSAALQQASDLRLKQSGTTKIEVAPPSAAPAAPAADPLEGRTATSPDGKKIDRRNGKWEPM